MAIDINHSTDTVTSTINGIEIVSEVINNYNATNAAFSEANSFQSVINTSYATANVGFTAFGVANSGQNLALSAFSEANSFQSIINSAFTHANSHDSIIGTIGTTANSGQNLALSSFAEANSFQSVINTSYATANVSFSAYANANAALAMGNSFQSIINSAFTLANTDATNITIINGVDLSQNANIAAAFNEANSFQSIINSAFAEANSFQSIINSAFSRANTLDGIGLLTVTATSGVAVGGGSTTTLTANGTIALTANSGSVTTPGVVQLNDTIFSTSPSLAATANSVNTTWAYAQAAFVLANSLSGGSGIANLRFQASGGLTVNSGSFLYVTSASNTVVLGTNSASVTQVGVVQLNDTTMSQSTTLAATANAVNTVWAYAQSAFAKANTGGGGGIGNPLNADFTAIDLIANSNVYTGNVIANNTINSASLILNTLNVGGNYTLTKKDSGSMIVYNNTAMLNVNTSCYDVGVGANAGYQGFRVVITQANTGLIYVQNTDANTVVYSPTGNTCPTGPNTSISIFVPYANTFIVGGNLPIPKNRASFQTAPPGSNPTAANSTTLFKMQGLSGSITPQVTGNIMITICGNHTTACTAATTGILYHIRYGTGTAPTSLALVQGNVASANQRYEHGNVVINADTFRPFSISGIVNNLTLNTAYWIDLAAQAVTIASDNPLTNVTISAMEF